MCSGKIPCHLLPEIWTKDFVAVPIELCGVILALCGVILAAADSKVAVWQTVSATKLFFVCLAMSIVSRAFSPVRFD